MINRGVWRKIDRAKIPENRRLISNNRNTGDRTKHIDIRTSFVKEYQEDGKIIIKFVKSEDNEADIFMKNTTNIIFQRHQEKQVWDKKEVSEGK